MAVRPYATSQRLWPARFARAVTSRVQRLIVELVADATHGVDQLRSRRIAFNQQALTAVRKAGLGLLMASATGTRRPLAFVEDTAVAPERLNEYVTRLKAILDALTCPVPGTPEIPGTPGSIGALGITATLDPVTTEFECRTCEELAALFALGEPVIVEIEIVEDVLGALTATEVEPKKNGRHRCECRDHDDDDDDDDDDDEDDDE